MISTLWPHLKFSEQHIENIYQKIYSNFMLELDAIDNGVSEAPQTLYRVSTGLGSRVHRMNKEWNAPKEKD